MAWGRRQLILDLVATLNDPTASLGKKDAAIWNKLKLPVINQGDCATVSSLDNDPLEGKITLAQTPPRHGAFHDPTGYGAGSHEEKSYSSSASNEGADFTLRYTISVSKTANIPPLAPQPLERVCNNNLPLTSVTASDDDGNVPQNVLDNNLNTRWSSDGVGQFITADLGSTKNICSVDIAWYRGNERMYRFVIATSSDGSTFTNVLTDASSGTTLKSISSIDIEPFTNQLAKIRVSSGTTLNSEKYTIPPTDARYVRVTVNGNTVNNFASITELDIFG